MLMNDVTSGVLKGKGLLSDQPRTGHVGFLSIAGPLQRRMIFIHFEIIILSFEDFSNRGSLYWLMYIVLLGDQVATAVWLSAECFLAHSDCLLELH